MPKLASALLLIASGAAAFSTPSAARPALNTLRASSPLMAEKLPPGWKKVKSMSRPGQFSYLNTKTGQRFDKLPRGGQTFYDDEKDTTAKPLWQWQSEQKDAEDLGYRSPQEAAGFAAGGEDLATAGGIYYVAFIPFLLFFVAYVFGTRCLCQSAARVITCRTPLLHDPVCASCAQVVSVTSTRVATSAKARRPLLLRSLPACSRIAVGLCCLRLNSERERPIARLWLIEEAGERRQVDRDLRLRVRARAKLSDGAA